MSSALALAIGSGFLMGLASSLHCAGMCGSIGSALAIAIHPDGGPGAAARALMPIQFGRVLAYAAAGGAVGLLGTSVVHLFDQAAVFLVLRVAGAATLVWIGLSTAGLLPSPAVFDRWATPVATAVLSASRALPGGTPAASVAAGIAWGFMPCAMVYAALFVAMLQGTPAGGAAFMLGFGFATVLPVMAASLGIAGLRQAARGRLRLLIGSSIAGLGALSLSLNPLADILCLTR
jgi:sulfite exporter TauE/SafE